MSNPHASCPQATVTAATHATFQATSQAASQTASQATTEASSQAELMERCIELVSERAEDLATLVYPRFFARFPEADELFGGSIGEGAKSNMILLLVFQLLELAEGKVYHHNIERWINDHIAYGVTLPMYATMFEALISSLQQVLGADWNPAMGEAWDCQIDKVMAYIERLYAAEMA